MALEREITKNRSGHSKCYARYSFGGTEIREFGQHTKAAVSHASEEAIASQRRGPTMS